MTEQQRAPSKENLEKRLLSIAMQISEVNSYVVFEALIQEYKTLDNCYKRITGIKFLDRYEDVPDPELPFDVK